MRVVRRRMHGLEVKVGASTDAGLLFVAVWLPLFKPIRPWFDVKHLRNAHVPSKMSSRWVSERDGEEEAETEPEEGYLNHQMQPGWWQFDRMGTNLEIHGSCFLSSSPWSFWSTCYIPTDEVLRFRFPGTSRCHPGHHLTRNVNQISSRFGTGLGMVLASFFQFQFLTAG